MPVYLCLVLVATVHNHTDRETENGTDINLANRERAVYLLTSRKKDRGRQMDSNRHTDSKMEACRHTGKWRETDKLTASQIKR